MIKIGDKVKVVLDGAVRELEIVDVMDVNPRLGKISWLSPIAQALLGKTGPQRIVVKAPSGKTIECKLLEPVL